MGELSVDQITQVSPPQGHIPTIVLAKPATPGLQTVFSTTEGVVPPPESVGNGDEYAVVGGALFEPVT